MVLIALRYPLVTTKPLYVSNRGSLFALNLTSISSIKVSVWRQMILVHYILIALIQLFQIYTLLWHYWHLFSALQVRIVRISLNFFFFIQRVHSRLNVCCRAYMR